MIYRTYGSTGLKVSAIGFGAMRFEDQQSPDDCTELVKDAYDAGINYFDTAPGYGKSEEIFGIALAVYYRFNQDKCMNVRFTLVAKVKGNSCAEPCAYKTDSVAADYSPKIVSETVHGNIIKLAIAFAGSMVVESLQ